ncbi:MAG: hypothetical protein KDD83_28070, partial [Caldilineaceae bacterium]|nr:hypothetical protein [Caldilineaceae bacterium]
LTTLEGTLFSEHHINVVARDALEQIYRYPLTEQARDSLNRQLRTGVRDEELTELVINLFEDDKLCIVHDRAGDDEARIICSLGLAP